MLNFEMTPETKKHLAIFIPWLIVLFQNYDFPDLIGGVLAIFAAYFVGFHGMTILLTTSKTIARLFTR